jgi:hypothetical protein
MAEIGMIFMADGPPARTLRRVASAMAGAATRDADGSRGGGREFDPPFVISGDRQGRAEPGDGRSAFGMPGCPVAGPEHVVAGGRLRTRVSRAFGDRTGGGQSRYRQCPEVPRPYPAFAVDRHWNIVLSNAALPQLYEGCSAELLRKPVNAVRLILHPEGLGPRILNFSAWRAHTISLLRQQLAARVDPVIKALLTEIAGYPVPPGSEPLESFGAAQRLATPLHISTRFGVVSFLNTLTVFGTPNDVTLSELALEMLFPADDKTIEIVQDMVRETNTPARVEAAR